MASGLRTVVNPETGLLELTTESLHDASVPGASAGVDPAMNAPAIAEFNDANALNTVPQVDAATAANTQATGELTDAQKAQKEQVKAENKAEQDALSFEQAKLKAKESAGEAGIDAVSGADPAFGTQQAELPVDPSVADPNIVDPNTLQQPELQGQPLYAEGSEQFQAGTEQEIALKAEEQLDRSRNLVDLSHETVAELKKSKEIEDQREEIKQQRIDIHDQIQTEINTNIKSPSPSALSLIGVFLSGLVAPYQNGKNVALEIVQARMEREVGISMANKKSRMQGLDDKLGVTEAQEDSLSKESVVQNIESAKWLKSFEMKLEGMSEMKNIPEKQKAELNKAVGSIKMLRGDHQTKAIESVWGNLQKKAESDERIATSVARRTAKAAGGRGGRGGRGGSAEEKETGGIVSRAKNSPLYFDVATGDTVDFTGLDPKVQTQARDELAQIPMVDTATGNVLRGIRGLAPKQAERMQKAWNDRNTVRTGTQRILRLLSQVEGSDRLVIGGASKTEQGAQLKAEFTQLMRALKDQWELGAIQKPDERLLEGAMGANPTDAFAFMASKLNVNQVQAVMQNLQSGGNLRMKTSLLSEAGLPSSFEIQMPRFDATSDIDERNKEVEPDSSEKTVGNLEAAVRTGDKKAIASKLSEVRQQLKAGQYTSEGIKSGGVVIDQKSLAKIVGIARKAGGSEKRQLYNSLNQMYFDNPKSGQVGVAPKSHKNIVAGIEDRFMDRPGFVRRGSKKSDRQRNLLLSSVRKSAEYKLEVGNAFNRVRDGKSAKSPKTAAEKETFLERGLRIQAKTKAARPKPEGTLDRIKRERKEKAERGE